MLILIGISLITFLLITLIDARMIRPGQDIAPWAMGQNQPVLLGYLRWFAGISIYAGDRVDQQRVTERACLFLVTLEQTVCDTGGGVVRADLGVSAKTGRPVWRQIIYHIPITLELAAAGVVLGSLFGLLLGILSLCYAPSMIDSLIRFLASIGYKIPAFGTGLLLVFLFGVYQNWFPAERWFSAADIQMNSLPLEEAFIDHLSQLFRPAIFLAFLWVSLLSRSLQTDLAALIRLDYLHTTQGQGWGAHRLWLSQALHYWRPNLVTTMGPALGHLLAATVIMEAFSAWPGLGRLTLISAIQRDYPVILGIIMVVTGLVMMAHLVDDILRGLYPPQTERPS